MHNIPNILSILRLCSVPVLLTLAWAGYPNAFLVLLAIAAFTDWLDGFIARRYDMTTDLGARLDSWADAAIYFTIAIAAYLLWPQAFFAEKWYFLTMVLTIVVPVSIGLIKFRVLTSYHSWMVKVAAASAVVSSLLLFLGFSAWPLRIATLLCIIASLEQIAITILSQQPLSDVRSVFHVYKSKNKS